MRLKLDSRFWIPDKEQTARCLDQHNDGRNVTWIKSEQTHIYTIVVLQSITFLAKHGKVLEPRAR